MLSTLCSVLQNLFCSNTKSIKCLAKISTNDNFKLLSVIYFQNFKICAMDMRFLVERNSALLCFLYAFFVLPFRYLVIRNIKLGHQLYNHCIGLCLPNSTTSVIKLGHQLYNHCIGLCLPNSTTSVIKLGHQLYNHCIGLCLPNSTTLSNFMNKCSCSAHFFKR